MFPTPGFAQAHPHKSVTAARNDQINAVVVQSTPSFWVASRRSLITWEEWIKAQIQLIIKKKDFQM